jgi:alanyl-tRNA synthetase
MTRLLYLDDPIQLQFPAKVAELLVLADGRNAVILPETCFYPTGGGQSHDTGSIGEANVVDVYKQEEQVIHVVDRPLLTGVYTATVDRDRRVRAMQHHTGQHLLSAVFLHTLGLDSVSATINAYTPSTVDIDCLDIDTGQLAEVESAANQIVFENRQVKSYFITDEDVPSIPFRKPPKVSGQIRVVEVDGYDYTPCGGTHCLQTGSIGLLKIIHTERMSRKLRVHFVAGVQALEYFHQYQSGTQQVAALLHTRPDDIMEGLQRQLEQSEQLRQENEILKAEALDHEAQRLALSAEPVGKARLIVRHAPGRASAELRSLAGRLNTNPNIISVLSSTSENKFNLVVGCSPGSGWDARQLLEGLLRPIAGKGGGDPAIAQGGGRLDDTLIPAIPERIRTWILSKS